MNDRAARSGYKIFKVDDTGRLMSAGAPEGGVHTYQPNEVTRPRAGCGPLALFSTLKEARYHASQWQGRLEVWEVEWQPWDDQLPRIDGVPHGLWCPMRYGWCLPVEDMPFGTRLARWVKPIRRADAEQPVSPVSKLETKEGDHEPERQPKETT
ncbi:MAG: hypothetical protein ACUVWX_14755 [Kiritimatiellia bacterium]